MVAGPQDPLDCLVQCNGGVPREYEPGAVPDAERFREPFARGKEVPGGAEGQDVAGAAGIPRAQDRRGDGFRNTPWLGERGRRVVEVDEIAEVDWVKTRGE